MALDVFDIVQLGCQWIVNVDDDNLPIRLLLVQQSHHAQHFDLLDLTWICYQLANLTHIERVVVALGFGFGVHNVWIFPGL